jgi:hypothetical protein
MIFNEYNKIINDDKDKKLKIHSLDIMKTS